MPECSGYTCTATVSQEGAYCTPTCIEDVRENDSYPITPEQAAVRLTAEVAALRDALESMCFQYLTGWNDDRNDMTNLEHSFMSAGEQATGVLARLFPSEWQITPTGARWRGPLDEHGHPLTHSWAAKLDRMRKAGMTDGE